MANRLYGYAQGVIAAGSISGGLLAGTLSKKLKPKFIPFLIAGCAFSMLIAGIALQAIVSAIWIYLILVICCGLLMVLEALFTIPIMAYLQMLMPNDLIGKVISCVMCICMCANPLGQFLYGALFETIGNRFAVPFYAAAAIVMGISVLTRRTFYGIDGLVEQKW